RYRMPVVLGPEMWPAWLGEEPADRRQLKAILAPYPSGEMVAWPVSPQVGQRQRQRSEPDRADSWRGLGGSEESDELAPMVHHTPRYAVPCCVRPRGSGSGPFCAPIAGERA